MNRQLNLFILNDEQITYNNAYKIKLNDEIKVGDFINFKVDYFNAISKKFEKKNKMIKIIKRDTNSLFGIIGGFYEKPVKKIDSKDNDLFKDFLDKKDW